MPFEKPRMIEVEQKDLITALRSVEDALAEFSYHYEPGTRHLLMHLKRAESSLRHTLSLDRPKYETED